MKKKELGLEYIWQIRLKIIEEAMNLTAEGDSLILKSRQLHGKAMELLKDNTFCIPAEIEKLFIESDMLRAKASKLYAETDYLHTESNKRWIEAVIAVYGNIKIEWIGKGKRDCSLETGEIFKG